MPVEHRITGNLEKDIAFVIEKYESKTQLAAHVINMINQDLKPIDLIHLYVGTVDALFSTMLSVQEENAKLKLALTHPLVVNAMIEDVQRLNDEKESQEETEVSQNTLFDEVDDSE